MILLTFFTAPHSQSKFGLATREAPKARSLTWSPSKRQSRNGGNTDIIIQFNNFGDNSNNGNNNNRFQNDFNSFSQQTIIIINEDSNNRLRDEQIRQERQFTQLVQEQLFFVQVQSFMCDNIRRNHFNSRNGRNVNTVIILVQQVIDNRRGQQEKRIVTRQIESNSRSNQQVVVIIQENTVINVDGRSRFQNGQFVGSQDNNNNSNGNGTESAQQDGQGISRQDYQPTDLNSFDQKINLIPAGIENPQFSFGQQSEDPAAIVLENQNFFVSQ